jgi:predicted metalloprotease with PDZ domain
MGDTAVRRTLLRIVASLAALSCTAAIAADLSVRVDARDVARKRLHVALRLAAKPGPLTLVYPKWMPGEHGPTGPLETLIGLEVRANGERLSWARDPLDMYALKVVVPRGADHLDVALEAGLATENGTFSAGPTSTELLAIIPWNECMLLPKGADADRLSTLATLVAPPDWQVVSALGITRAADGAYDFEVTSAASLIDSPTQLGRYARRVEIAGFEPGPALKHSISIMADSAAALATPDDFAAGYGRLVAESGALFGSRPYRSYTWILSLSDHVAHFGLEHHESSDDRDGEQALQEAERRMDVATLLGHEYVHAWNGKYRRPQGLLSPDFQRPMDGTLLWIYEGMTEFWGDVLPARAGLLTPDFLHDLLADAAAEFVLSPGARWRPMLDTAVAAQALYGAPSAWQASRRSTDYYDASVFLWLDVDQELRARSHGAAGLDDFARRFFAGPVGTPQLAPYTEQDVYAALAAIAPGDWRGFVHRHLDLTGTDALVGALERAGWRLNYSADKNVAVESRQKRHKSIERQWSIGLRLDKDANVVDAIEDRAAARAGVGPGMKLIGVGGRKYTAELLDTAIAEAQQARQPIVLLVENGEFYRTIAVPYYDGPRYPHLTRIAGRGDGLAAVTSARTH